MKKIGRKLPKFMSSIGESWEIVDRQDAQSMVLNGTLKGLSLRQLIEKDPEGIVGDGHKADQPFPLLYKIIDAGDDLSLQVHPDEESCKFIEGAEPKTEMWYVIDHKKGAEILAGIADKVSVEKFFKNLTKPSIRNLMKKFVSRKGKAFLIKATTIHSIGGGNLIYEIQQNSNTTFRVSDWGRVGSDGKPRQLHINEALTCMNHRNNRIGVIPFETLNCSYSPTSDRPCFEIKNLACSNYFKVDEFKVEGKTEFNESGAGFQTLFAVNSNLEIFCNGRKFIMKKGQTCLIPAATGTFQVNSKGKSKFIRSCAA